MIRFLIVPIATIAMAGAASAHITFDQQRAAAGSYFTGFLRVGHGCDGAATTMIRVTIPAGIDLVRPEPKSGWTLTIEHQPLATPIRGEGGEMVKERVATITWRGGPLPADEFDQFGLMMKLPATVGPLYFPTTQQCEKGTNDWINVPVSPAQWHMTKMPAPMLILTPPAPQG